MVTMSQIDGLSTFSCIIHRYSKTEDLAPGGPEMMSYTHLLIGKKIQFLMAFECWEKIVLECYGYCAFNSVFTTSETGTEKRTWNRTIGGQ